VNRCAGPNVFKEGSRTFPQRVKLWLFAAISGRVEEDAEKVTLQTKTYLKG